MKPATSNAKATTYPTTPLHVLDLVNASDSKYLPNFCSATYLLIPTSGARLRCGAHALHYALEPHYRSQGHSSTPTRDGIADLISALRPTELVGSLATNGNSDNRLEADIRTTPAFDRNFSFDQLAGAAAQCGNFVVGVVMIGDEGSDSDSDPDEEDVMGKLWVLDGRTVMDAEPTALWLLCHAGHHWEALVKAEDWHSRSSKAVAGVREFVFEVRLGNGGKKKELGGGGHDGSGNSDRKELRGEYRDNETRLQRTNSDDESNGEVYDSGKLGKNDRHAASKLTGIRLHKSDAGRKSNTVDQSKSNDESDSDDESDSTGEVHHSGKLGKKEMYAGSRPMCIRLHKSDAVLGSDAVDKSKTGDASDSDDANDSDDTSDSDYENNSDDESDSDYESDSNDDGEESDSDSSKN